MDLAQNESARPIGSYASPHGALPQLAASLGLSLSGSHLILAGAAAALVLVVALIVARWVWRRKRLNKLTTSTSSQRLEGYIREIEGRGKPAESATKPDIRDAVHGVEVRSQRVRRFSRQLADANIPLYPFEWVVAVFICSAVLALALTFLFSNPVVSVLVAIATGYFGSGYVVGSRQVRRRRAFDAQLGEVLILIANAMRAGASFSQAMSATADDTLPPIRNELRRFSSEVELGLPVEQALHNMLQRNPSWDLQIAVSAIQIHREVGGNLAAMLEQISETIRERVTLRQEVRVITAQARLSGYIVAAIPFLLGIVLNLISPGYFHVMLTQPLGITILAVSAFMIAGGFLIIRQIVDIQL